MKYLILIFGCWLLPFVLFAQEYRPVVFAGDTCWQLPERDGVADYQEIVLKVKREK